MGDNDTLLEVMGLETRFYLKEGVVRAVNGVDLEIKRGRVLGVVGESGCGKSVMARSVMRIEAPGRIAAGKIVWHRTHARGASQISEHLELTSLNPTGPVIRGIRGREISMIFQEPMTSFGPMHTIGNQIMETLLLHQDMTRREARGLAIEALASVGMPRPAQVVDQYPHQLSGGMRQRAMIAMALCCQPSLLIADEPTTALDVTTEAQILELLRERQHSLGMAIMYITHSLGVVAQMADDVVVMYLGKIVERSDVDSLFYAAMHPYTQALLKSIPRVDQDIQGRLASIEGTVPDPYHVPAGCAFHPRCSSAKPGICDVREPPIVMLGGNRSVCCHLYG